MYRNKSLDKRFKKFNWCLRDDPDELATIQYQLLHIILKLLLERLHVPDSAMLVKGRSSLIYIVACSCQVWWIRQQIWCFAQVKAGFTNQENNEISLGYDSTLVYVQAVKHVLITQSCFVGKEYLSLFLQVVHIFCGKIENCDDIGITMYFANL